MPRQRWKRKSGYVSDRPVLPKKVMEEEDLFLDRFYDDWEDWRDGMRDWFGDSKLIKRVKPSLKNIYRDKFEKRVRMNKKQKRLAKRRIGRKALRA